eukprot:scaffold2026_cov78-Cylindrotheca_fusiformis.AAC.4
MITAMASISSSPTVVDKVLQKMLQAETLLVSPPFNKKDELQQVRKKRKLGPIAPIPYRANQWRIQTAKWCYDVIDHLQLSRDIVHVSMNILERFLVSKDITNKAEYELSAISSLFLGIRLSPKKTKNKLEIAHLLMISGASWTVADVQSTTASILKTLNLLRLTGPGEMKYQWNSAFHQALVLATPQAFAKALLASLPTSKVEAKKSWMETALYLLELSVCDGGFQHLLPSHLALASIVVASKKKKIPILDENDDDDNNNDGFVTKMFQALDAPDVSFICGRLEHVYQQSQQNADNNNNNNGQSSCPTLIVDDEDDEEEELLEPTTKTTTPHVPSPNTHLQSISPCFSLDTR